jgi:hypothetical protein
MRYGKFEVYLFYLIPPFIYLSYLVSVIDTWKRCLAYSILIPFFCAFPVEIFNSIAAGKYIAGLSIPVSLFLSPLLILLSSHNVLIAKRKVDTWRKGLAYSFIPLLCFASLELFFGVIARIDYFIKGDFSYFSHFNLRNGLAISIYFFLFYSMPMILFFALDSLRKKDHQNETEQDSSTQTAWMQYAQLIGLDTSNTKKFVLAAIIFYIVSFVLIHCFAALKSSNELLSIFIFFVFSLGSLLLIFPAVALRPVMAISSCLLLPLFWSVLFRGIYAAMPILIWYPRPPSFLLSESGDYQNLSNPDFYITPYLELSRWYASFPLLAIWGAYYWLKKTELRRGAITKINHE